jgi:hypothetical protein
MSLHINQSIMDKAISIMASIKSVSARRKWRAKIKCRRRRNQWRGDIGGIFGVMKEMIINQWRNG